MRQLKTICLYIVSAFILNISSILLGSDFLYSFLFSNIVMFLIMMLAINTATSALIMARLNELSKGDLTLFREPIKELKLSLIEQIILIATAVLLSILNNSDIFKEAIKYPTIILGTLITTIFIYAIDVLRDTGMAIFMAYDFKKK